jgi:DNA-binding NarL/FixJ family response regulator
MKKILLIEDEPRMRGNIAVILEMENFRVTTRADGAGGVEQARREKPDLIICDIMMPGLDGYGVLEALRRDPDTSAIPFIFLTAKSEWLDVRAGMNIGADDYLVKPVKVDDLLRAVRSRLERADQQRSRSRRSPDFSSAAPLKALGLTSREAEVLSWVAQGKSNSEISIILGAAEPTVKKHLEHIFEKLGVENRNAAALRAIEALAS